MQRSKDEEAEGRKEEEREDQRMLRRKGEGWRRRRSGPGGVRRCEGRVSRRGGRESFS